jgi:hypothetical protein
LKLIFLTNTPCKTKHYTRKTRIRRYKPQTKTKMTKKTTSPVKRQTKEEKKAAVKIEIAAIQKMITAHNRIIKADKVNTNLVDDYMKQNNLKTIRLKGLTAYKVEKMQKTMSEQITKNDVAGYVATGKEINLVIIKYLKLKKAA